MIRLRSMLIAVPLLCCSQSRPGQGANTLATPPGAAGSKIDLADYRLRLGSADYHVPLNALIDLKRLPVGAGSLLLDDMLRLLEDPSDETCVAATEAIRAVGPPALAAEGDRIVAAFLRTGLRPQEPETGCWGVGPDVLGEFGPQVVPILIRQFSRGDELEALAGDALCFTNDAPELRKASVLALVQLFEDSRMRPKAQELVGFIIENNGSEFLAWAAPHVLTRVQTGLRIEGELGGWVRLAASLGAYGAPLIPVLEEIDRLERTKTGSSETKAAMSLWVIRTAVAAKQSR